jgi:alkanesulfonate monooxygenase SsuD/methylene tetrahydromethanopterin reductase-like flavin-dependent oxidoreductase (luciferase family)
VNDTPETKPPSPVRLGINLSHQRFADADPVVFMNEQLALLRKARDLGFDSVFSGQHHLSETFAVVQPLPWLGKVTAEAGDMIVGTGIHLLALHNPVDTAEAYATLDVMCEGRSVFGVGLGYRSVEYEAFGINPREKITRFTTNLALVKELWSGAEVHADLPWVKLAGVRAEMRPAASPRPPIWMAANSDKAVRRAARLADTWMINPHATMATIGRQLDLFNAERATAGLPPPEELPIMREIFCAPTRARALELARPHLERKYSVYADWGQDLVMPDKESFRTHYHELASDRFIVGTPDDCIAGLQAWRERHGINHFMLRTDWAGMPVEHSLASVELLGREVLPALREMTAARPFRNAAVPTSYQETST